MGMQAFFERLGDLAFKETRSVTIPAGNAIPADEYGFLEYYCTDDNCDCRRVIIRVVGRHSGNKLWATISYGWENAAFYRKWSPGMADRSLLRWRPSSLIGSGHWICRRALRSAKDEGERVTMALKNSELYSSLVHLRPVSVGMDVSPYKDYVLVLLFIKYVSDKYALRETLQTHLCSVSLVGEIY